MRHARRAPRLVATLLALAPIAAAGAEAPVGACGPITRRHDHVAFRAEHLRRLGRTPIERIGVLAIQGGRTVPIPFQIEESRGRKPTLEGRGAKIDQLPGLLDFDDVLLFLPCHAGTQATEADRAGWAGQLGVTAWREIRIRDPLTDAVAFAYVIVAPAPPHDDTRFVGYADTDLVSTAAYRIGMAGALPVFFAMLVDGRPTANLLDGLRLNATGTLRTGLSSVTLTERDARHELTATGAGPIRVVRRSEHFVDVALGIELGVGTAHTYFYPLRITGPGKMSLPFSPGLLFRDIDASGGVDLTGLDGWTFAAAGATPPFDVNGRADGPERGFAARGRWFLLRNGPTALLTVMRTSPNLRRAAPLEVLYVDDATAPDERGRVSGHVPFVGFRAGGLAQLPADRYEFTFDVLFEPAWTAGREVELLRQVDTPLVAELSARSDPAIAPAAHR